MLTPSWIIRHLFALAIFVTMIGLGIWQLDRLAQRRESNAARQAVLAQNPATVTGQPADAPALVGRRVRVTGTFLNEQSMVLRGQRSASGVDGVHLLVPLRVSGSDHAVIVDRGWLPADQRAPAARAAYAIAREVTIEGVALAPQARPDAPLAGMDLPLPDEDRIDAWLRVDVGRMQEQIDAPLLPLYIEQLPEPGAAGLPQARDPALLDEGPHLGYALQWFAFAAILLVVYAGLIRQMLGKSPASYRRAP